MHASTTGRRRALAVALPAVLALSVTACGSSDADEGTATSDSANAAILGTPNKATGSPITIGFITDGKTPALDNSDEYRAAKAAAAYANEHLGGIAGHKIEVKVCEARQDPAVSTDCANQMVSAKAVAVVQSTLANVDQTISVLSPAGIPIVSSSGSTPAALSTPNFFSLFNGLSYFGAPAADAAKQGVKKAAMVVIAVPAAEGPARTVGTALYANAGVKLDVAAMPPGTADMTPQIVRAKADNPDLYHIFGNGDFCTPAIQAVKAVDPDAKITVIAQCLSKAGAQAIPGGYKDIRAVTTVDLDPANEETKLFSAILEKWGDGAATSTQSGNGYSPMLGFISALNAAKISDISPSGVISSLKSAPATTYPLAAGAQFKCDGKQMGISPNVCSSNGIMATVTSDGELADYELIASDPELYALSAN